MLGQIAAAKANQSEFSEVILNHFALKKDDILKRVEEWKNDTGIPQADYDALKAQLASLTPTQPAP